MHRLFFPGKKTSFVLVILLALLQSAYGSASDWPDLRSGTLELRPDTEDELQIQWRYAWLSEANPEKLFLINAKGELADILEIPATQTDGRHSMRLHPEQAPYLLVIPGYSFRNYSISHGKYTASIFEPERVHQTASFPERQVLYFRVPARQQAIFAGKYHSGADRIILTRLSDHYRQILELKTKQPYSAFDSVALPTSSGDEFWSMTVNKGGKIAFWLDGVDNRFARHPEHLSNSVSLPGRADVILLHEPRGHTPAIGVALPYLLPPDTSHAPLKGLNLQAASYYSFVDYIDNGDGRELDFRSFYAKQMGIHSSLTLMAGKDRRAVLHATRKSFEGLHLWLQDSLQLPPGGIHYLAFADEPNLNFPSYESFAEYFSAMLSYLKQQPDFTHSGVKVAVPASSRFLHGPMRDDAYRRRGIDWAARLLKQHAEDIDAIAWHEWMVRNLYATGLYSDTIRAAADLVGYDDKGRPLKVLLIDQTNISSGNSVSPYEQNTHFAALWWASVIIQSSSDGLLSMLNWFHVADEADHQKGFFFLRNDRLQAKPVARAQAFLTERWLSQVNRIDNNSFELDALHTREGDEQQLLGVNKSRRVYKLHVDMRQNCPQKLTARVLDADGRIQTLPFVCTDTQLELNIPAQGIFKLEWEGSHAYR